MKKSKEVIDEKGNMSLEELRKGYEEEVAYQKHMLQNLGYWFQLATIISGIGIVVLYFYQAKSLGLKILGIALFVLGALGMLLFGYSGWKGQQNVQAVIDDYEKKIHYLKVQQKSKN